MPTRPWEQTLPIQPFPPYIGHLRKCRQKDGPPNLQTNIPFFIPAPAFNEIHSLRLAICRLASPCVTVSTPHSDCLQVRFTSLHFTLLHFTWLLLAHFKYAVGCIKLLSLVPITYLFNTLLCHVFISFPKKFETRRCHFDKISTSYRITNDIKCQVFFSILYIRGYKWGCSQGPNIIFIINK